MPGHLPLRTLAQLQEVWDELLFTADALLAAGVGPWEIHHNAQELYLSDQWLAVFGGETTTMRFREYIESFESDNQNGFLEQINTAFRQGVCATVEFHHKLAGRAVISRGRVVEPGRMVGADLLL